MTTPKTKTKTNSAEEFIRRKNEYFKKNNIIKVKDISRRGYHIWIREAWTFMPQFNLDEKVFVIERLRRKGYEGQTEGQRQWGEGDVEYRFGYYIVGKIGRAKGKWVWGQFCPFVPKEDFSKLLNKAKQEGTLL